MWARVGRIYDIIFVYWAWRCVKRIDFLKNKRGMILFTIFDFYSIKHLKVYQTKSYYQLICFQRHNINL